MKDKSWIIIIIMAIALVISLGYSVYLNNRNKQMESTATTTSIIEMTATTVTIKNTLTGTGLIEYKEIEEEQTENESTNNNVTNNETENYESTNSDEETNETENESTNEENINSTKEESTEEDEEENKVYQITLSIEDKDLEKVEVGESVEIVVTENENSLNYLGSVIKVNELSNNKSTINIEIKDADNNIKEGETATCTVITEKAENVVGLPIEAIQTNENGETYVNVVQEDETTKSVIIETGISDNYYVEITSGLVAGDRVQIIKTKTIENNNNETMQNQV